MIDSNDLLVKRINESAMSTPLIIDFPLETNSEGDQYDHKIRCQDDMIELLKRRNLISRTLGVVGGMSRFGVPEIGVKPVQPYVFIQFKTESDAMQFSDTIEEEARINPQYRKYRARMAPVEVILGLANFRIVNKIA